MHLKKKILLSKMHDEVRYLKRLIYKGEINYTSLYDVCYELGYSVDEIKEAIKLNECYYSRLKRVKKRFDKMVNYTLMNKGYKLIFLTFTLDDNNIDKKFKTLRVYVHRFLNNYTLDYVANCDYGKKRGRLHFHAVVLVDKDINYKNWGLGALNGEVINLKQGDEVRSKVSKYITKLSAHALKDTARFESLIYCRNVKVNYE